MPQARIALGRLHGPVSVNRRRGESTELQRATKAREHDASWRRNGTAVLILMSGPNTPRARGPMQDESPRAPRRGGASSDPRASPLGLPERSLAGPAESFAALARLTLGISDQRALPLGLPCTLTRGPRPRPFACSLDPLAQIRGASHSWTPCTLTRGTGPAPSRAASLRLAASNVSASE